jgi:hypothetical protein
MSFHQHPRREFLLSHRRSFPTYLSPFENTEQMMFTFQYTDSPGSRALAYRPTKEEAEIYHAEKVAAGCEPTEVTEALSSIPWLWDVIRSVPK